MAMLFTTAYAEPSLRVGSSSASAGPLALKKSAATAQMGAGCCEFTVPFTGTLTAQGQAAIACTLRRLIIEMRYGTRLKGLTVTAGDHVLTINAVASNFAIQKWLDSGDFSAALDRAVAQAR